MPLNKTLVISNMYPSALNRAKGTFVKNIHKNDKYDLVAKFGQGRLGYISLYLRIIISLVSLRYDRICIHYPPLTAPFFFLTPKRIRNKTTLYYHGSDFFSESDGLLMGYWKKFFLYMLVKQKISLSVPSLTFGEKFRKIGYTKKIQVHLGGGINTSKKLKIVDTARPWDFAVISRMTNEKGIGDLIRHIENSDILPGSSWLLVGRGSLVSELIACLIRSGQKVKHIDEIEQSLLMKLYLDISVVVAPTRRESLGLVVAEALAMGCCVVARPLEVFTEMYHAISTINYFDFGLLTASDFSNCLREANSSFVKRNSNAIKVRQRFDNNSSL